ncbi:penicillin-binding protein 1A [Noviherbaspirillum pedocola]|uniref:penicillin-binding protein 1A n=1 Tax=Noviherbaspirillum pedocola TaxID=2801341 RepID=UPI0038994C0C
MEDFKPPVTRTERARRLGSRIGRVTITRGAALIRHIVDDYAGALDKDAPRKARIGSGAKALAATGGLLLTLLTLYTLLLIPFTPSIRDLKKAKVDQPSVLMSIDGKRIASFRRSNREWVPLERISPNVVNALISTEDRRFFDHHGVDFKRVLGSAAHSLSGNLQGGSTITQQLARNLYPEEIGRSRSLTRKLKELITAFKIEHAYSKREILETYLNTVPFLYNAWGIEMAARTYFDKPAAKLDVLESATLIGMLKGTSYYNPVTNPERAKARRNVVLAQMEKNGHLNASRRQALAARPIRLDFERQDEDQGPAPHFARQVRKWLIEWADENDYNIYLDGLVVTTTLDSRMQAAANAAVERQMDRLQAVADVEWALPSSRLLSTNPGAYAAMARRIKPFAYFRSSHAETMDAFVRESAQYRAAVDGGMKPDDALARLEADKDFMSKLFAGKTRLQAGFIALDPASGAVRAWVGSRDFDEDQYDHVSRAQRQPGSTFKPFVYGAALLKGMTPDTTFVDGPVEIPLGHGQVWRPTDLEPPSNAPMTLADGLAYSKNTITAQVMAQVGPNKVADLAAAMGVNGSRLDAVPALALGTSPVTMLEMATAYGTIANGGTARAPLMVTRIADRDGNVLAEFDGDGRRALPENIAKELVDMLRGVVNRGTGAGIRAQFGIRGDIAGKTGTTQNNTDGWFMLMHPQLVAGAWVGFNDARITMRSSYWGQGAHNALYLVGDFFRQAQNGRMIDARARFGGGELPEPAPARTEEAPIPAAPTPAPSQDAPAPAPQDDELERIIEQARQATDQGQQPGQPAQ